MSLVNYAAREIVSKIVYYGPARSGKTTNLHYIHARVPEPRRGPIVSLATEGDRTLFFDYLPLDLGRVSGFRTRIQLYTVPGQIYYDSTRRLVLQSADGIVFVADSRPDRQDENLESFRNLQSNLLEEGIDPKSVPLCFQYNKRDLPQVLPSMQLEADLNYRGLRSFPASALTGEGVFDTLEAIMGLVLTGLAQQFEETTEAVGRTNA
ncbi:MAG: gliding-motility protein MglA [Gemmatimonas sp.]|nr:gliding-motility protein MglA [Gemmatimonas sp.]